MIETSLLQAHPCWLVETIGDHEPVAVGSYHRRRAEVADRLATTATRSESGPRRTLCPSGAGRHRAPGPAPMPPPEVGLRGTRSRQPGTDHVI